MILANDVDMGICIIIIGAEKSQICPIFMC